MYRKGDRERERELERACIVMARKRVRESMHSDGKKERREGEG